MASSSLQYCTKPIKLTIHSEGDGLAREGALARERTIVSASAGARAHLVLLWLSLLGNYDQHVDLCMHFKCHVSKTTRAGPTFSVVAHFNTKIKIIQ